MILDFVQNFWTGIFIHKIYWFPLCRKCNNSNDTWMICVICSRKRSRHVWSSSSSTIIISQKPHTHTCIHIRRQLRRTFIFTIIANKNVKFRNLCFSVWLNCIEPKCVQCAPPPYMVHSKSSVDVGSFFFFLFVVVDIFRVYIRYVSLTTAFHILSIYLFCNIIFTKFLYACICLGAINSFGGCVFRQIYSKYFNWNKNLKTWAKIYVYKIYESHPLKERKKNGPATITMKSSAAHLLMACVDNNKYACIYRQERATYPTNQTYTE